MKNHLLGTVALAMLTSLAGCGVEDDAAYDESSSALSVTGPTIYDSATTCVVGGLSMHCCPPGMAMIGAHVKLNVFKCQQLTGFATGPFQDVETKRNGMHTCPDGAVMVGLHVGADRLACRVPNPQPSFELVDGNPPHNDTFPMHVCPPSYAMAGIQVNKNLFTCDF